MSSVFTLRDVNRRSGVQAKKLKTWQRKVGRIPGTAAQQKIPRRVIKNGVLSIVQDDDDEASDEELAEEPGGADNQPADHSSSIDHPISPPLPLSSPASSNSRKRKVAAPRRHVSAPPEEEENYNDDEKSVDSEELEETEKSLNKKMNASIVQRFQKSLKNSAEDSSEEQNSPQSKKARRNMPVTNLVRQHAYEMRVATRSTVSCSADKSHKIPIGAFEKWRKSSEKHEEEEKEIPKEIRNLQDFKEEDEDLQRAIELSLQEENDREPGFFSSAPLALSDGDTEDEMRKIEEEENRQKQHKQQGKEFQCPQCGQPASASINIRTLFVDSHTYLESVPVLTLAALRQRAFERFSTLGAAGFTKVSLCASDSDPTLLWNFVRRWHSISGALKELFGQRPEKAKFSNWRDYEQESLVAWKMEK